MQYVKKHKTDKMENLRSPSYVLREQRPSVCENLNPMIAPRSGDPESVADERLKLFYPRQPRRRPRHTEYLMKNLDLGGLNVESVRAVEREMMYLKNHCGDWLDSRGPSYHSTLMSATPADLFCRAKADGLNAQDLVLDVCFFANTGLDWPNLKPDDDGPLRMTVGEMKSYIGVPAPYGSTPDSPISPLRYILAHTDTLYLGMPHAGLVLLYAEVANGRVRVGRLCSHIKRMMENRADVNMEPPSLREAFAEYLHLFYTDAQERALTLLMRHTLKKAYRSLSEKITLERCAKLFSMLTYPHLYVDWSEEIYRVPDEDSQEYADLKEHLLEILRLALGNSKCYTEELFSFGLRL